MYSSDDSILLYFIFYHYYISQKYGWCYHISQIRLPGMKNVMPPPSLENRILPIMASCNLFPWVVRTIHGKFIPLVLHSGSSIHVVCLLVRHHLSAAILLGGSTNKTSGASSFYANEISVTCWIYGAAIFVHINFIFCEFCCWYHRIWLICFIHVPVQKIAWGTD